MGVEFESNDVWAMVFGLVTFRLAGVFRGLFVPEPSHAVMVVLTTATAVFLLLAPLLPIDWERHGTVLGVWLLVLFGAAFVVLYLTGEGGVATDVELFVVEGARSLVAGENPYTTDYAAAAADVPFGSTRRIDGSLVTTLSYPAGMVIAFVPQRLLGVESAGPTVALFALAFLIVLVADTPDELVVLPFLFCFALVPLVSVGLYGGVGPVWLFPLALGMHWWGDSPRASAAAVGLAAAVKQLVWPLLPFLGLWLWLDADDPAAFRREATQRVVAGGSAFLLPNLPFVVASPLAWTRAVLDPAGGGAEPLVERGLGVAALSTTGVYPLSRLAHTALVALLVVVCAGLYVRWWPRSRWAAFTVTPVVLLGHYRFLGNYFIYFAPIAFYAWVRHNQETGAFS